MSAYKVRILIVDNHPLVREGLTARLETVPSFEIVGMASNGQEALGILDKTHCDLLLTDVGMKGICGIELTRTVAERHPGIAVLILSGYEDPGLVHQAMVAGARGYVLKDGPSAHIVIAVETVASGGTYLSPSVASILFGPRSVEKQLSVREIQVLTCLAQGNSSKQIAKQLSISVRTVESYRQDIKRKFYLPGQAELIKFAVERYGGWGLESMPDAIMRTRMTAT